MTKKNSVFWDAMLYSLEVTNIVEILVPPSTLKLEAICSSETLVIIYQTAHCHIPKEIIILFTAVRTSNIYMTSFYIVR
jgi:hypothetical protein